MSFLKAGDKERLRYKRRQKENEEEEDGDRKRRRQQEKETGMKGGRQIRRGDSKKSWK